MFNNWAGALQTAQAAGPAVTGTAAATLLPSGAQFNFPSNYWNIGTKLRVTSSGVITTVAAPGTLTLDFRVGGTVVHSIVTPTLAASQTGVAWKFEADLTVRSIGNGTGATVVACSRLTGPLLTALLAQAADAVGTGFNSTASNYFDHFATFSITGNSITLQQFSVEMLN